jgi:sialic acid synthase SpsE
MGRDVEFIAEFSINHMGHRTLLHRMAEKAIDAGADYIKLMKKNVYEFYEQEKLDAPFRSPFGTT